MRTTIDLPDDLFRQVKARAALEGRKLKDLLAEYVEQGLSRSSIPGELRRRARSEIPIARPATGVPIPALTNAEIEEIFAHEDAARACGG